MATKIKRSLFIGLGGTGMSTLLSTKRFFIETYGEVPPMIGFLGIDTDENFYNKSLPSKKGDVSLNPGEICKIQVANPLAIYRLNADEVYGWLPKKNTRSLTSLTQGAGQIRSNGRFAFSVNYAKILNSFKTKLVSITDAIIINNPKYELLSSAVDVHLVFSVGGGTGCGTFIDFAYLIQEHARDVRLSSYAVLPGIFEAFMRGPSIKNVKPNTYGAILDLDYLMHFFTQTNPHTFKYSGHEVEIKEPPFQSLVVVDNKNENGDTYTHIDQITEMLGLSLVTAAGEFSNANASALDNVEKVIATRAMDVKDKSAYACGMGMSEILFDGEQLAKLYSIKAARRLIERMTNTCISKDVNTLANSWIDSPEVNIREDRGQDNVIDFILTKSPKVRFSDSTLNSNTNPSIDVDSYFEDTAKPSKDEVDSKVDTLLKRVKDELKKTVIEKVNGEFGIGTTLSFLNELERQVNIFLTEMNDELKDWQTKDKNNRSRVGNAVEDLKTALALGFFTIGRKSKIAEATDELVNQVNSKSISIREIIRRESAINFFTGLKNSISDEKTKINSFNNSLRSINHKIGIEINKIQISGEQQQIFVLNLHNEYSKNIEVENSTLGVEEFSRTLTNADKIYGILNLQTDSIQKYLLDYTQNISETLRLKQMSINEVLKNLSKEEYSNLIKKAIAKSLPLMSLDYKGYPTPELHEAFIVGVPDNSNTILNGDGEELKENLEDRKPTFSEFVGGPDKVDIISTGAKDRIIIYRQRAAVPVFALGGIKEYYEQYNQSLIDCHFDNSVFERIQNERFSVFPKDTRKDDSIELWVRAIIFNFITNESGYYYLKTKNRILTSALNNYRLKLNDETNRREQAFKKFKEVRHQIREELIQEIEKFVSDKGSTAIEEIRKNVKSGDNYIAMDIAKVGMSKEWISRRGQEEIQRLILDEIEFIENSF